MDTPSPPPWDPERLARAAAPAARQPSPRRLRGRAEPPPELADPRHGRSGGVRARVAALLAALRRRVLG